MHTNVYTHADIYIHTHTLTHIHFQLSELPTFVSPSCTFQIYLSEPPWSGLLVGSAAIGRRARGRRRRRSKPTGGKAKSLGVVTFADEILAPITSFLHMLTTGIVGKVSVTCLLIGGK